MKKLSNLVVKSTQHSKPILTDVLFKNNGQQKPVVIFCHGYKGFKDWGAWNNMAETFAENNVFFVKFNFSHNGGTLENPIDFPDLEAFGKNNFTIELDDLEDVIQWLLQEKTFSDEIDKNNITLIGHSRGGGIVTIKASENNKIANVISWNGVSDYASRFPKGEELEQWKKKNVFYVLNSRTNQKMPHLYQFYENFKTNEDRLTIQRAVESLKIPHLIVAGTGDSVVTVAEAENMHKWNPNSELFVVKDMNHTLGSAHPWTAKELPKDLKAVVQKSIQFIK
ncbi:alpha/beta hydrolase family protein [Lutibacter sp.]